MLFFPASPGELLGVWKNRPFTNNRFVAACQGVLAHTKTPDRDLLDEPDPFESFRLRRGGQITVNQSWPTFPCATIGKDLLRFSRLLQQLKRLFDVLIVR